MSPAVLAEAWRAAEGVFTLGILQDAVRIVFRAVWGTIVGMAELMGSGLPEFGLVPHPVGGDDTCSGVQKGQANDSPVFLPVVRGGDVLVSQTYNGCLVVDLLSEFRYDLVGTVPRLGIVLQFLSERLVGKNDNFLDKHGTKFFPMFLYVCLQPFCLGL